MQVVDKKEYQKKYYLKNNDKIKEYRFKNKEKHCEYQKKYRLENKEKISTSRGKYYQIHKEYCNKKSKEYNKKYPEKKLASDIKYLKKYGFPLKLDPYTYKFALKSWSKTVKKLGNGLCLVCNLKAEISHHIIHKSKYPELSLNTNNGIPLCKICHYEVHGWNILN